MTCGLETVNEEEYWKENENEIGRNKNAEVDENEVIKNEVIWGTVKVTSVSKTVQESWLINKFGVHTVYYVYICKLISLKWRTIIWAEDRFCRITCKIVRNQRIYK